MKYYAQLHLPATIVCSLAIALYFGINILVEATIGSKSTWQQFGWIYYAGAGVWGSLLLLAYRFPEDHRWHPHSWAQASIAVGGLAAAIWWIRSLNSDINTPIPGLLGLLVIMCSPYAMPAPPPNTWYHRLLTYLDNEMLKAPENYQGPGW